MYEMIALKPFHTYNGSGKPLQQVLPPTSFRSYQYHSSTSLSINHHCFLNNSLSFSFVPLGMYIESVKQQHEKASSPIFVTESEI